MNYLTEQISTLNEEIRKKNIVFVYGSGKRKTQEQLDRIAADSGYESIENYTYLKERHLKAFIKPSDHERTKTRRYAQDSSHRENMTYVNECCRT